MKYFDDKFIYVQKRNGKNDEMGDIHTIKMKKIKLLDEKWKNKITHQMKNFRKYLSNK